MASGAAGGTWQGENSAGEPLARQLTAAAQLPQQAPAQEQSALQGGVGGEGAARPPPAPDLPPTPPLSLLALPNSTLTHILGRLTSVADLARCGATCTALRELVATHTWPGASLLQPTAWGPHLAAGLAWAAQRCPGVVALSLSGLGAVGPEDLAPLSTLARVQELSLRDCSRLRVRWVVLSGAREVVHPGGRLL